MIDYINVKLTVNYDAEIERTVEFLSRLCARAHVGTTKPYNPSWCTVDVHLEDCDEEGPFGTGLAVVTVPIKDAPFLRGLLDHVLGAPDWWACGELIERAEAHEQMEEADEKARMQYEWRGFLDENGLDETEFTLSDFRNEM